MRADDQREERIDKQREEREREREIGGGREGGREVGRTRQRFNGREMQGRTIDFLFPSSFTYFAFVSFHS